MLETLNLALKVEKEAYKKTFPGLQERLRRLQYDLQEAEIATVVVFEGVDAVGKGTTIGRLVQRLDPRLYRVVPATAPSAQEKGRHFLWRYQMKLPGDGTMTIYDRSWYGRVLVERFDGDVTNEEVHRAYHEIRDFERWLADDGQVIVKFWLHIDRKLQKKRLRKMEGDALHSWKVSKEDWKHHEEFEKWILAAEQMFTATDTPYAPWTLIPAADKRRCRIMVFETLIRRMEEALGRRLSDPKAVSRTTAAEALGKADREKSAAEMSTRAREAAAAAGLPLEEAPEPVKAPKGVAKRKRKRKPARKGKAKKGKRSGAAAAAGGR
jgi:polyphosphate kinase 2 (PPK2 family)